MIARADSDAEAAKESPEEAVHGERGDRDRVAVTATADRRRQAQAGTASLADRAIATSTATSTVEREAVHRRVELQHPVRMEEDEPQPR
jgi:hypothetical protein